MKAELLYPELTLRIGDRANAQILKRAFPQITWIETSLGDTPAFTTGEVSLVYMGNTEETDIEAIIEALKPYREVLCSEIQKGTLFFLTGNAWEILAEKVVDPEYGTVNGLGLYPVESHRNYAKRKNGLTVSETAWGLRMAGIYGSYTECVRKEELPYFSKSIRQAGNTIFSDIEGIYDNGLLATTFVGAVLSYNIDLLRYLAKQLNMELPKEHLFEVIESASRRAINKFSDSKVIGIFEA